MTARPCLIATIAMFLGCAGDPFGGLDTSERGRQTVDASCVDSGLPAAILRLNCHRRLAGLDGAGGDALLSAAAQAHADYMMATGESGHGEGDPTAVAFTGSQPADRVAAAGYALDASVSRLAEVIAFRAAGADAAIATDNWINTVYHREPLMTPEITDAGAGQAGIHDVMMLVTPWTLDASRAVVYPAPGQTDVPTTFDSDTESPDPLPGLGLVGPPLSVSVVGTQFLTNEDPFGLRIVEDESWIRGPGGIDIDATVLDPGNDPHLLRLAALLPTEPLEPGTTYEVQITYVTNEGGASERWAFATQRGSQ